MNQVRILYMILILSLAGMGTWVWKAKQDEMTANAMIVKVEQSKAVELAMKDKERQEALAAQNDESQKVARAYGALYTPEFFVLNRERKVVYMGALDDRDNPANVKAHFLDDAVEATLKGRTPATQETLARGCRIRYQRARE